MYLWLCKSGGKEKLSQTDTKICKVQVTFFMPHRINVPLFKKDPDLMREFGVPTDLPDITFLRKLSIEGRLRFFQNATDISITPPTGETFFFYRLIGNNATSTQDDLVITNDGNTRLTVDTGLGAAPPFVINFIDSIVGNGVRALTFSKGQIGGISVFGWVENTSRIRDPTI